MLHRKCTGGGGGSSARGQVEMDEWLCGADEGAAGTAASKNSKLNWKLLNWTVAEWTCRRIHNNAHKQKKTMKNRRRTFVQEDGRGGGDGGDPHRWWWWWLLPMIRKTGFFGFAAVVDTFKVPDRATTTNTAQKLKPKKMKSCTKSTPTNGKPKLAS